MLRRVAFVLALSLPVPVQAQVRFPAVPAPQIEEMVANSYCGRNVSTIARTVARIDGWRGFAMRLCSPDYQPAGVFVAWFEQSGERRIVVTQPSGQPLQMVPQPLNDGNQQAIFTLFSTQIGPQRVGCAFGRSNWLSEPWSSTFCEPIDAQGRPLNRR